MTDEKIAEHFLQMTYLLGRCRQELHHNCQMYPSFLITQIDNEIKKLTEDMLKP